MGGDTDQGRFRLQGWREGARTPYVDELSQDLAALKARAAGLLDEGYGCVDLSAWNLELNDWVRLERDEGKSKLVSSQAQGSAIERARIQAATSRDVPGPRRRPDGANGVGLLGDQPPAVQAQEEARRQEGRALVAVDERMVAGDGHEIGRRQFADVIHAFVVEAVGRPRERGFQQSLVAQPGAPVQSNAAVVEDDQALLRGPARLRHLASARKASRYSSMKLFAERDFLGHPGS